MENKTDYKMVEFEVITFENSDIITDSNDTDDENINGG